MASFLKNARRYATRQSGHNNTVIKPKKREALEVPSDLYKPRDIELRGGSLDLQSCRDKEVMLEGPFGTGKTVGALAYIYQMMDQYPGIRVLFLKKTKSEVGKSVLVSWEEHVVPEGHPMLSQTQEEMFNRDGYTHLNGSEVIIGGLHNKNAIKKVKSTEFDLIYVNEMDQITKAEWEILTGRLRHYKMPFQQILGDINPIHPMSWPNQRAIHGRLVRLKTKLSDNPRYHDGKDWTAEGADYRDTLESIGGVEYMRNVLGLWCASEGAVYADYFSEDLNVDSEPPQYYPMDWSRIWVTDFGFTNPFVWQQWAIDADGVMWLELEIYKTKTLLDDLCDMWKAATMPTPIPVAWLCDHDAQDRAELENKMSLPTFPAYKAVRAGIDAVCARLRPQANGRPRMMVRSDALIHPPDKDLVEKGWPTCTAHEFAVYAYPDGGSIKDEPVKEFDHGMDCVRYGTAWQDKLGTSRTPPGQVIRVENQSSRRYA